MNADPNARDKLLNDLSSTLTPASEPIADTPPAPPVIPDHELIRRIGRGSYGEVWLARTALGTWRAVKIVHRAAFDHDRPYEREFEGIRRFEPISRTHPSQLNVLHVGRNDAAGHFYYVMELADAAEPRVESSELSVKSAATASDGPSTLNLQPSTYVPRTLRSELQQRGRVPFEECLQISLALATALDHLHRHGLVHRDIKPSNIIFVNGIPKLADIGLVARAEATLSMVGTEGYLPPEGPGTAQADIFSLGKVLYEMATGRDRQEFPELPTNLIQQPAAERAQLAELNEIIVSACHADLKQRYQTAAELHADLALLQSGKSVSRMRTTERRLKVVARAGALVTAVAVIAGLAFFYQQVQTREARRLAAENARLGEENRQRIVRLDVANGVRLLDEGDPAGALLWFADALPLVANKPAEESIHRIRIQQTLNQTPRLLQVFPHKDMVSSFAFSQDGQRIVTGTQWGELRVWDARTGGTVMQSQALDVDRVWQTRFTRDGQRVFVSSLRPSGFVDGYIQPTNVAAILDVETGRRVVSLSGTNLVRADLSPDERWLVTADTDHVIRVHDARDGRPVADLKGHTNRILEFSFSTNGNVLASSGQDRTVRLWRLPSGEPIGLPIPFARQSIWITLSQDGRLLATDGQGFDAGTNSIIEIWDVETGARVEPPIEMAGSLGTVCFLPPDDHRLLIITDKDNGVFDRESHARLFPPIKIERGFRNFAISPDGQRIAWGGAEGLMGVWSLESGELVFPPWLQKRDLADIGFSPDGTQLLTAGDDGTALLLSLHFPQESASYRFDAAMDKRPPKVLLEWHRFSPDRRHFLHILADRTVRLVDFEQMTDQRIPADQFKGLKAIQATFDTSGRRGAIYYSGGDTHLVEIWNEDGRITNRFVLPHPADLSGHLLFTPDGSRLITPGRDGQIRFWRTSDGTLERSIQLAEELTGEVLFPDGRTAFAAHREKAFALFDLITGSITKTPMPPFEITALRFNSSGDRFASAGAVSWSRVWSARTCEPLTPPLHHGGEVRWVDWSPDGKRLLTAGLTPEVKVWDASTGEQLLAPLSLGSKPLETALWSPDGRFVVARSDENTVRVWDANIGEPVTPVLPHSGYVRLASLVANNRLVTLSLPNLMRAWDLNETPLPLDVLADYAKLVSGRRLNAQGVMLALKPDELAELSRSLRARAPQLFE